MLFFILHFFFRVLLMSADLAISLHTRHKVCCALSFDDYYLTHSHYYISYVSFMRQTKKKQTYLPVLKKAIMLEEMNGQRKRGRPKMT